MSGFDFLAITDEELREELKDEAPERIRQLLDDGVLLKITEKQELLAAEAFDKFESGEMTNDDLVVFIDSWKKLEVLRLALGAAEGRLKLFQSKVQDVLAASQENDGALSDDKLIHEMKGMLDVMSRKTGGVRGKKKEQGDE